jgi:hypothetical protein
VSERREAPQAEDLVTTALVKSDTVLANYERTRAALERCATVDEAKRIKDQADALRVYGRQANDSDLERWAAEIKVRAMRRIGEISATLEKAKAGTKKGGSRGGSYESPRNGLSKETTLKNAGLSKQAAHRCEQIAAIPERVFEQHIAEKKAAGKPVHSTELLSKARVEGKRQDDAAFNETLPPELRKTPAQAVRDNPAARWSGIMHQLSVEIGSIEEIGGVKALTKGWSAKDRLDFVSELEAIRDQLDAWIKSAKEY